MARRRASVLQGVSDPETAHRIVLDLASVAEQRQRGMTALFSYQRRRDAYLSSRAQWSSDIGRELLAGPDSERRNRIEIRLERWRKPVDDIFEISLKPRLVTRPT